MVEMSAADKAALMSETTQQYVSRRGMVAEAYWDGSAWVPNETDNDGLWTAMYGAGELMRYAVLRDKLEQDPSNTELQRMTAEARKTAMSSTEAVLLLANISMRTGDTEAYVRYITDGGYDLYGTLPVYNNGGKGISDKALLKDGDYSLTTPDISPAPIHSTARRAATPTAIAAQSIMTFRTTMNRILLPSANQTAAGL